MWAVKEFTKRRKCRESKRMRDEVQRHHPKNIRFNPFVCLKLDVRLQTESFYSLSKKGEGHGGERYTSREEWGLRVFIGLLLD